MSDIKEIYLDNAATTAVYPSVAELMGNMLRTDYGNPSALYHYGDTAKTIINEARGVIAQTLNASPNEIYFTSGGSESDNWAIKGIALANSGRGKHIITSTIEHKAILKSCQWLEQYGFDVDYVLPDQRGFINPNDILQLIREDTILVSIMTANNEIGTIQPIRRIGEICHDHRILFHTDAVQAYGHINIDVNAFNIDLLSASGHKFHGPKGVGFLYIRDGIEITPLIQGGGQENGLRAGTENVVSIAGMGLAAKLSNNQLHDQSDIKIAGVRDYFINKIIENNDGVTLNGTLIDRLPNNISFTFDGISAQTAVSLLSETGVYCSAGSACNNGDATPSHVLTAIGKTPDEARSTLRFTIDENTTKEDIDYAVHMIKTIVDLLR